MDDDPSSSPSLPPQRSAKPQLFLPPSCEPAHPDALEQKVWVIFGGSTSLAHALIQTAISQNDCVASIAQSHVEEENLDSLIPPSLLHLSTSTSTSTSSSTKSPLLLPLPCDIRIRESVHRAITLTISHFGRIDIIVNCCGYGVVAAAEDQDEYDIREQFEVNYFGVLNILHCTLGYFRERWRRSHQQDARQYTERDEDGIVAESLGESEEMSEEAPPAKKKRKVGNDKGETPKEAAGGKFIFLNNSIAGGGSAGGIPGLAPYCAARAAVEGLVESMHYEVDELGIKCTLVETGLMMRGAGGGGSGSGSGSGNGEHDGISTATAANTATRLKDSAEGDARDKVNGHTTITTTTTTAATAATAATSNNTTNNCHSSNMLGTHPFTFKPPSAPYSSSTSPSGHARRILHLLSTSSTSPPPFPPSLSSTSPSPNYNASTSPSPNLPINNHSNSHSNNNSGLNKTALLIHQLAHCKFPPLRLYLGAYAVEGVRDRLRVLGEEVDEWRWLNFEAREDGPGGNSGGEEEGE